MIYLDTHAAAWLYQGEVRRFSGAARKSIEREELTVSPMVEMELSLLHEIGRIRPSAQTIVRVLEESFGVRVCSLSFAQVIRVAAEERWTRDPFDRIIVAQAKANGAGLVTSDVRIRQNYGLAVW